MRDYGIVGWIAIIVITAIVVWGLVQVVQALAGAA
jgi:hypothetical protein